MTVTTTPQPRRPVTDEPPVLNEIVTDSIPRSYEGRFERTKKLKERAHELRRRARIGFRLIDSTKESESDNSDRYRIIDTLKFDPDYPPARPARSESR